MHVTELNQTAQRVATTIEHALATTADTLVTIGICGAQGSGKSTIAAQLAAHFNAHNIPTAILSIDDLYRTRAERMALAHDIHPLLATRGVPGTHDVALGLNVLRSLSAGQPAPLPRFDKAEDDRLPESSWPHAPANTKLSLFEGWCVGARPQPAAALAEPVNTLERDSDPAGIWRHHVNAALAGDYQTLFARLDRLVLLAAPDFATVRRWRHEQESALRAERAGQGAAIMDDATLDRFLDHYDRLTGHILAEMPARADLLIPLGPDRLPLPPISPN
jgi:D-glycerate 3-kinase